MGCTNIEIKNESLWQKIQFLYANLVLRKFRIFSRNRLKRNVPIFASKLEMRNFRPNFLYNVVFAKRITLFAVNTIQLINLIPILSNIIPFISNHIPILSNLIPLLFNLIPILSNFIPILSNLNPILSNLIPRLSNLIST